MQERPRSSTEGVSSWHVRALAEYRPGPFPLRRARVRGTVGRSRTQALAESWRLCGPSVLEVRGLWPRGLAAPYPQALFKVLDLAETAASHACGNDGPDELAARLIT